MKTEEKSARDILENIFAIYTPTHRFKAAFRGELKGISKEELDRIKGSQKIKDSIFQEIQKIQIEKQL